MLFKKKKEKKGLATKRVEKDVSVLVRTYVQSLRLLYPMLSVMLLLNPTTTTKGQLFCVALLVFVPQVLHFIPFSLFA